MMHRKRLYVILSLATLLTYGYTQAGNSITSANTTSQQSQTQDTEDTRGISEAFGHFIGRNLKTTGVNFDVESLVKGIRDGAAGKPAPMSDQEYEEKMTALQERAFKHLSDENLKAANEFLDKNKKENKIVELEPGKLQYVVVQEGKGPVVTDQSTPLIEYTGTYIDGTVFGSSKDTGGPITIPLSQTIPGFSKALVGMKEGEKRKIFVHPDLGYGVSGHLPPNSLLIFDVEVLKANNSNSKDNDENKTSDAGEFGPTASFGSHSLDWDDEDEEEDEDMDYD